MSVRDFRDRDKRAVFDVERTIFATCWLYMLLSGFLVDLLFLVCFQPELWLLFEFLQ